ncbi:MAG: hypothetical protein RIR97_440, partial [Pseudomonadota bacterium]
GGAGGWFLGKMLAAKVAPPAETAVGHAATPAADASHGEAAKHGEAEKPGDGPPKISTEANNVIAIEPITTNLFYPSDSVIRIELALLFKGAPDVALAETIHQDVMEYLKTVSLQDIQGSSGFKNLKEDIQERVDLRSEGRVSQVMFRTFVIE